MDKKDLKPFISARMRKASGRTLMGIYNYFIGGLSVENAAFEAGVSKQAINPHIKRIKRELQVNGWRVSRQWVKPMV